MVPVIEYVLIEIYILIIDLYLTCSKIFKISNSSSQEEHDEIDWNPFP